MQLQQPSTALVEPLGTFFPRWCTYSVACSRRLGCLRPDECGTDSLTSFIMREDKSGAGRVAICGDRVAVNFPNARNQQSVFARFVALNARSHHHRCQDCRHFKDCYEAVEDYNGSDDDDGPRHKRAVPATNVTPEEMYAHQEWLQKILDAAPEKQREEILAHITGESFVDIGRERDKNPDALRQSFMRFKRKVAPLFRRKFPGGRKR